MLETLSEEQLALTSVVRDKWLKQFFTPKRIDEDRLKQGLTFLYELVDRPAPKISIVESPMQVKKLLGSEYGDALLRLDLDYGWVAFYDFFQEIGIVKSTNFDRFKDLLISGVYDIATAQDECICIQPPLFIRRDEEHNLHSLDGPAVEWGDGFQQFFISGVSFDQSLFHRTVSKSISAQELLGLDNIEQKRVGLKIYGLEKCLDALGARHIVTSLRGNQLYFIEDSEIFGEPTYFLRYSDPSTGETYVSAIPSEVGINGDPDECMAWKFHLTKEEYAELRKES